MKDAIFFLKRNGGEIADQAILPVEMDTEEVRDLFYSENLNPELDGDKIIIQAI
ncbi:MAG: hypothetical protein HPY53_12445 [Brevinematales bacterium]|nr:hypothetical protein [Brevinematales bacterium]